MKDAPPNINCYWATLLVEELWRCGVRAIGVAPGSRSSPLAESVASHGGHAVVVHPDERGLGFHMLGHALASGRPTAIITTSGTAAANLFPAIAEAHHAGVPLIAITADRPPELRDCGANQATDQIKLFGSFVRFFADLPVPTEKIEPGFLLGTVDAAIAAATSQPRGPVHFNMMFREPLAPVARSYSFKKLQRALGAWPKNDAPWLRHELVKTEPDCSPELLQRIATAERGIILAGALDRTAAVSVRALAEHLGWPLLPDLQSGLRLGDAGASVISQADALLASERFAEGGGSDLLLQFGSRFVTRRLNALSASNGIKERIIVDCAEGRVDPHHRSALRVQACPAQIAEALRKKVPARPATEWLESWASASARVEHEWETRLVGRKTLSEPGVAALLSSILTEEDVWFVGNSLPIRMAATFATGKGAAVRVLANRGLSGIDGLVATAAGCAAGSGKRVTLALGDLSLLHDLNSLALLRSASVPVTIIAINNDGGGIFSLLPIAESARHFERVFAAPHGMRFRAAAQLFELSYAAPTSPSAFVRAWRAARRSSRSTLIEVSTRRGETARVVRQAIASVVRTLDRRSP